MLKIVYIPQGKLVGLWHIGVALSGVHELSSGSVVLLILYGFDIYPPQPANVKSSVHTNLKI